MTVAPEQRPLLDIAPHARGKRLPITCALKCDDACAKPVPNQSTNSTFRDVVSAAFTRRTLLGGATATAALSLVTVTAGTAAADTAVMHPGRGRDRWNRRHPLRFTAIDPVPADTDAFTTAEGYDWHPIISWGDPILPGAPDFDPNNQTGAAQATQFGYNNDYLDIIALNRFNTHAVLCSNHEYTNEGIMFDVVKDADGNFILTDDQKRVAMYAHGFSVVEVRRRCRRDRWEYQKSAYLNRRFTVDTEFGVDGPAAGSDLLKTKDDATGKVVRGTLNNCAGSTTPWGTILSGEENFNGYFVANETPETKRYGIGSDPAKNRRKWWTVDPRFDARSDDYKNEVHRFGWVIEIDPHDPTSTPMKHTALGRFKHEGAAVRLANDRRAVAYSGDDERFDYLYKFISKNKMRKGSSKMTREYNKTLLAEGDLYVAKFIGNSPAGEITGDGTLPADGRFDGTGKWLQLTKDGKSMVPGMTIEEVLVYTRMAADQLGATKMDRPEDVEPNPLTGRVYVACTNNSKRGKDDNAVADEPNPRNINREGHVVEIIEDRNDAAATTFRWNLLLVCGEPGSAGTYFGGYTGEVSPISCPDNLAFDSRGNLWVSTDGQPKTIGYCDALHKVSLRGRERGRVQQFLAVPREAETCGPVVHDREDTVYVAVQHPGEGGSWTKPTSLFPDYDKGVDGWKGPRPTVVQVGRFTRQGRTPREDLQNVDLGELTGDDLQDALRDVTSLPESKIVEHTEAMKGMSDKQIRSYLRDTLGVAEVSS